MSDIICACGHPINAHYTTGGNDYHCWIEHGNSVSSCICSLSPNDIAQEKINEISSWKEEAIELCVVDWIEPTTARETLRNLIASNVAQALDPKISKMAQDLIEEHTKEMKAKIEKLEKRIDELMIIEGF